MNPIHICVPVLRRYDLLRGMIESLKASTVKPACIYIINNGRDTDALHSAIPDTDFYFKVHTPERPMGIAESWNWFIRTVPEDRIITNDDIVFSFDSLEKIQAVDPSADLVWCSGFSCYMLRQSGIDKIGLFDETISPGYGYYEDCDYIERIKLAEAKAIDVDSGVIHLGVGSATWRSGTPEQQAEHWARYTIARANFVKKWGKLPHPGL